MKKRLLFALISFLVVFSAIIVLNSVQAQIMPPIAFPDANEDWQPITETVGWGTPTVPWAAGYFTDLSATNLTVTATTTSPLLLDDGTVSAPAYSFMSDTDTGIFRLSVNELSFGAGGSEGLRIDFNELEVQPLMTLATGPIELEEDSGAVTAINLPVSATPTAGDEMSFSFAIDSNVILKVKALADSAGGIDTKSLEVTGDFAVDTNLLFVDDSADMVGISTSTPATLLDIFSTGTSTITIDSNSATQGACLKLKDVDGGGYSYGYVLNGAITWSVNSCE